MTATMPHSPTIDSTDLRQLLAENPDLRVLDVRTGGEFETVHIPGSFSVPLESLAEHASELADLAQPIVLVCQSGARAAQAHSTIAGFGKDQLHVLDGGIEAWQADDGDVVRGAVERWAMDRQVRLVAGSLVLAGVAASVAFPPAKFFAGAIGGGLTFSAVSNTCTMARVLSKLPYNRTEDFDLAGVIARINDPEQ